MLLLINYNYILPHHNILNICKFNSHLALICRKLLRFFLIFSSSCFNYKFKLKHSLLNNPDSAVDLDSYQFHLEVLVGNTAHFSMNVLPFLSPHMKMYYLLLL